MLYKLMRKHKRNSLLSNNFQVAGASPPRPGHEALCQTSDASNGDFGTELDLLLREDVNNQFASDLDDLFLASDPTRLWNTTLDLSQTGTSCKYLFSYPPIPAHRVILGVILG
jgi:hypothetical protein